MSVQLYGEGTFHLKMKLSGSKEKIGFFHFLLGNLDADWPFREDENPATCKVCDGYEYINPRFGVQDLKALATQVQELKKIPGNFKIKIRGFRNADKCLKILSAYTGAN